MEAINITLSKYKVFKSRISNDIITWVEVDCIDTSSGTGIMKEYLIISDYKRYTKIKHKNIF